MMVQEVAAALHVEEKASQQLIETLVSALAGKENLLLVLDNCEHLLPDCVHMVNRLLADCNGLRILAPGRGALGLSEECLWRVLSLLVPPEPIPLRFEGPLSEPALARLRNIALSLSSLRE